MYDNCKKIMKKISILHWTVSPIYLNSQGGLEVVELKQLAELNKFCDVKLFAPKIVGDIDNVFAIKHLGFLMKYDFFYYYNFVRINKDADCYIGYNNPLLALFEPKKTVIYFQNFIKFFGDKSFLPFYSIFRNRYIKAKYIFCSDFLKTEFLLRYPDFDTSRLFVNYNGVENNPDERVDDFGKNKSIVFMGQWNYDKGFDLVLDCAEKLRKIRHDFTFHLIGSDTLWNNNKSLCKYKFDDCDYIKLVGKLEHNKLIDYIRNKDILLVPARWNEPFGIVAIEGLAAGMIVLTSGVGGLKDIIKNDYNGFIFKTENITDLVKSLNEILSLDLDKINLLRKNGYLDVNNKFSWEIHIKKLWDILNHD